MPSVLFEKDMNRLIKQTALLFVILIIQNYSQASFQIPITVQNGTVTIVNKLGVNSGNSIGVDTASLLGGYKEILAPPPPPPPFELDSRYVTIPGRVSTFPIGLGGGIFNDFRGYTSPTQVDTFKIKIDGEGTDNNSTFISWPSNLSLYADAWTIKPQTGTSWPVVDMLLQSSVEIPAGATKNILIIKSGARGFTGVDDANLFTPGDFDLKQNFPNPFNPSTTVSFSLPYEAKVNLSVYNSLGELVSTLIDAIVLSGNHTRIFDASSIPSGVYLIKLDAIGIENASRFSKSVKSILIK